MWANSHVPSNILEKIESFVSGVHRLVVGLLPQQALTVLQLQRNSASPSLGNVVEVVLEVGVENFTDWAQYMMFPTHPY